MDFCFSLGDQLVALSFFMSKYIFTDTEIGYLINKLSPYYEDEDIRTVIRLLVSRLSSEKETAWNIKNISDQPTGKK